MSKSNRLFFFLTLAAFFVPPALAIGQSTDPLRNENRKIRVQPSPQAGRIGTAIHWESNWETAVRRAEDSGKPIFWYVPTVPGTFMDRKVELDRYMLAGPFSNPAIIEHLNGNYTPLRAVPTREQAEQFELQPYKFVEPGLLVFDGRNEVARRIDRITTLNLEWLAGWIGIEGDRFWTACGIPQAWKQFREGREILEGVEPDLVNGADRHPTERALLRGMLAFRKGQHAEAKQLWTEASLAQPDHPLAWKAAAEAEGFGPFVRGFEVYAELPTAAFEAGIKSTGSAAPPNVYTEAELWRRGVQFLLEMQRDDGAWVDSDYDFGGYDSMPNVHAAITALCGIALLDARKRVGESMLPEVDQAISKAAEFVANDRNLNPNDEDEILWAYAYRARFFARLLQDNNGSDPNEIMRGHLQHATEALEKVQLKSGGWAHEYANPFVTATALTALHAAQTNGAKLDSEKVESGIQSLLNDRHPNGAYPYNSRRRSGDRPVPTTDASAGRMAIGELALWRWRRIEADQMQRAAETSLAGQKFLDLAYKYDNHTSTMAYGGFFFWFDMQARAELIAAIPDRALRAELAHSQYELMMRLPEIDGCFVDSHELGRCYGTAMALISFALLAPHLEPAADEGSNLQAELMQADRDFARTARERGLEGWLSCFAQDAARMPKFGGPITVGAEPRRQLDSAIFEDPNKILSWDPIEAHSFDGGQIGLTRGRYDVLQLAEGGGEKSIGSGSYLTWWRRDSQGKWQVIFDTGTPDPPKNPN